MRSPISATIFRVWNPTEFGEGYDDYTREEALEYMHAHHKARGFAIPEDEDELFWDFMAIHFPEPLVYNDKNELVNLYNGLPPFDHNKPVYGPIIDTTGEQGDLFND